jgi:hypothetical protein
MLRVPYMCCAALRRIAGPQDEVWSFLIRPALWGRAWAGGLAPAIVGAEKRLSLQTPDAALCEMEMSA